MRDEGRRYVVYGAGAVGCAIAAGLALAGRRVVAIARGAQLETLRAGPLRIDTPSRALVVPLPVVSGPAELGLTRADVVILAMKSQDTVPALEALSLSAPGDVTVVCAQNGVSNEREATARFSSVLGMLVFTPALYADPGRISIHTEPTFGGLDLGPYPEGEPTRVGGIVADLVAGGFDARPEPRILRLKYGKLLTNLANALQALGGRGAMQPHLLERLEAEALACYAAAGIAFAPALEVHQRHAGVRDMEVGGERRRGGSSWQSLARGTGTLETDHLNGEIVRLGERHGIATPANAALVALAARAVTEGWGPEHLSPADLEQALGGPPRAGR